MNKSELIQAIADEAELSKRAAAEFVDAFVSVVTQELKDGCRAGAATILPKGWALR